jgi:F-type H+-transporting ATPase subunit a
MASEETSNSSDYILHHLKNQTVSLGDSPFWTVNVDTLVTSVVLGIIGMGFLWWVVRGATSGVPGRRQALVELAVDFIDNEVKSIFHGDRRAFVAPAALTVFVWILLMNAMDFLPVDWFSTLLFGHVLGVHYWRPVPTADVATTFALSLSVWLLMIFFSFKIKGVGGFAKELVTAPFHAHSPIVKIVLAPFNLGLNLVEYISKPLSHSLRLYGNMYAGEIIFLLLGLWAASGVVGTVGSALLGAGWAIFHILIVALQAYIFMMLTVVYVASAYESH